MHRLFGENKLIAFGNSQGIDFIAMNDTYRIIIFKQHFSVYNRDIILS
ncbi:MAG: hypothetical protein PHI47_00565 [Sulfuricurvum sp.]|nr:hypothetical protein [Sulfuricurvum sp.]